MNADSQTADRPDTAQLRHTMVDCQLRTYDVTNHAVLASMTEVPREAFLPQELLPLAYSDRAIELVAGDARRTLLAPMVLARMLQAADIASEDNVLCVGGGSGYGAAVVSGLASQVVALEANAGLNDLAEAGYEALAIGNVKTVTGDLTAGEAGSGPFDAIIVEGAVEIRPEKLLAQLAPGGRLIAIERQAGSAQTVSCRAVRYEKPAGSDSGPTGPTALFSCAGSVLPGFAASKQFTF